MLRNFFQAVLISAALVGCASAQEWANKMFSVRSHDFGSVARGAKSEFQFEITNLYEEEVHIASVRTSCHCTTPSIVNPTLKTWEKGAILAVFNTGSFLGQRQATVTVTIDKPFFAEVQLRVSGFIRSDLTFTPSFVDLGNVDQGAASERKININYTGRSNWKITDVRSANLNFEVELGEPHRNGGSVNYEMKVRLKPDAPAGSIHEELVLVTDDSAAANVPIVVEGRVTPALSVSPASLFLGELTPGQEVTKNLVLHGKRPFKITDIKCAASGFSFKPPTAPKATQVVPVTFKAGDKPVHLEVRIEIATDIGSGAVTATGVVKDGPSEPGKAAVSSSPPDGK